MIPSGFKKWALPLYIVFLLFSFFFVRNALNEGKIKVEEKEPEKEAFEVKPVVVYLNVETPSGIYNYRARMKNENSVTDFMDYLRENEGFYYEKTEYTYGVEFDEINRIYAPEGMKWIIIQGDADITKYANKSLLNDETTYTIKLVDENYENPIE